ncbi:RnfABCDGE type electron transport complex subunit D [candidate division KSB1 bacterium]|nr:RnfABCDGE type electron transport complex subunit D [candidate division KSB1 bacterium]
MEKKLFVSSSPHITDRESVAKIMFTVIAALVPAGIGGVYFFGPKALWVILVSVLASVATEAVIQILMKKPVTVGDGSAILTGILLAFTISVQVPLWIPAVGAFFAIAVGKQVFGGLGFNPMNPALLGRAFLLASWPDYMIRFDLARPRGGHLAGIPINIDGITEATPLNVFRQLRDIYSNTTEFTGVQPDVHQQIDTLTSSYTSIKNLFIGDVGGCIGETSALLLLAGAAFLMYKRYIGWKIPFGYIGTVALLSWIFGGKTDLFSGNILFFVFSGGLILGAFYMATDMVTSPVTFRGRILFGIGCGVITVLIRQVGGYPEGVCYSILLMNLTVPLLDRWNRPKVFGKVKK